MAENTGLQVQTDPVGEVAVRSFRSCPDLSKSGGAIVTSLDLSTVPGRRELRKALMSETEGKEKWINTVLDMVNVTAHHVSTNDKETGEVQEFTRCVLHLADGSMVAFGSLGINKSIMVLSVLERMPPWNPPFRVTLRQRTLDGGRIWLELEPVDDEPAPTVGVGKKKG